MTDFPLLKNMLDERLVEQISARIAAVYPQFADRDFIRDVSVRLEALELKARSGLIADKLRAHLPAEYPTALRVLVDILDAEERGFAPFDDPGLRLMAIPAFVEKYGPDHPKASLDAMPIITRYSSCEFAIRPFLIHHPDLTLARLQEWARDDDEHVRRLVSEGTRPRLPWAPQLIDFIADPAPTLALLEHLKDDPSLYVRRSVANHLNDICKDHPDVVLDTLEDWKADASEERLWLINHALRTLIKRGDPRALALLGYDAPKVTLSALKMNPQTLKFGSDLSFSFSLRNIGDSAQQLMIDYVMHFMKANGKTAPKVFKLKKATLAAGDTLRLEKSHSIRPISTRRYYPGCQRLEIQINGRILAGADFELVMD